MPRQAAKEKRTFSLSRDSVAYLKSIAKHHRSASEALDKIIQEKMKEAEQRRNSAGIRSYYDSIGKVEREEDRAWGEFAESQLTPE